MTRCGQPRAKPIDEYAQTIVMPRRREPLGLGSEHGVRGIEADPIHRLGRDAALDHAPEVVAVENERERVDRVRSRFRIVLQYVETLDVDWLTALGDTRDDRAGKNHLDRQRLVAEIGDNARPRPWVFALETADDTIPLGSVEPRQTFFESPTTEVLGRGTRPVLELDGNRPVPREQIREVE